MPDLTDFQLEVTRLFFSLPASKGFCWPGERPCRATPRSETEDTLRHVRWLR